MMSRLLRLTLVIQTIADAVLDVQFFNGLFSTAVFRIHIFLIQISDVF